MGSIIPGGRRLNSGDGVIITLHKLQLAVHSARKQATATEMNIT